MNPRNAPKRSVAILLVCCLTAMSVLSCATTDEISKTESAACGTSPRWIENYPIDALYYIGIGSSNTGNKSDDLEFAKARALTDLASSISTIIKSEQKYVSREDTAGANYESAEIAIQQTVEKNLQQVEMVDSWYCPDDGYWFYFRLSKHTWEELQQKEMQVLRERIEGIVSPVLDRTSSTINERLAALEKGLSVLSESPYSGQVEGSIGNSEGILLDIIENQFVTYSKSLSIAIKKAPREIEVNTTTNIAFNVQSSLPHLPGKLNGEITVNEIGKDEVHDRFTTEQDGSYVSELTFEGHSPGNYSITIRVDIGEGLNAEIEKSFPLSIVPPTVALRVGTPQDLPAAVLFDSVKSILSKKFLFQIVGEDKDSSFSLIFDFHVRDIPKNDNDIYFCYIQTVVSLEKEGKSLYSYSAPEQKEGGLSKEQARNRVLKKVLKNIDELDGYKDSIVSIVQ